jgi:hypothetical protein
MAHALANGLVVGAQWETLIGLQKEMAEIRSLARSRDASHYVVADDGAGTRTVGLLSLGVAADVAVPVAQYALAALIGALVDGPNVAFIHPDPDNSANAFFVTLRDRRPELDMAIPASQLKRRLEQWCSEIEGPVKVAGVSCLDLPQADVALTLDDVLASLQKDASADARLKPVRTSLPVRQVRIAATAIVALALVGGAGLWAWSWYDGMQQERRARANQVDPIEAYRQALARAIAAEPFSTGASYARRLQHAVQRLPADAGGWRPASIDCKGDRCEIDWRRSEGGTFDLLLSQRPDARIVDLDHASETLTLANDAPLPAQTAPASSAVASGAASAAEASAVDAAEDDGDAGVTPVPHHQFLRTAGARLQALGDYGMDISLTMPAPLTPVPPGVAARRDVPPPILKGQWTMAGHLAFFDSVAGLMMRAGNMSLVELKIVIDDGKPVFSAKGTYYVH